MALNYNTTAGGANNSLADAPKTPSPVDALLQELSETVRDARAEVQELVNQLESVRQIAPREKKDQAREVGACQTEEKLLEAIAGLRGMIEGVRATKAELRVW
jgi:F0F1-type ATP synthase membrane subunit b/b'